MGGTSKCLMMLTMSPCATDLLETLDTLKFAVRTGLIVSNEQKKWMPSVTRYEAFKEWEIPERKCLEFCGFS